METEQNIESSALMQELEKVLPKMNFYRFCQLLEQLYAKEPILGRSETPTGDPLRFAPSVDMSFPASELQYIERSPYLNRGYIQPSIHNTILSNLVKISLPSLFFKWW